jgi:hypothetical protein
MFTEPTTNDFLDLIRTLLAKEADEARRAVEQIERDMARTGQTGNGIFRTFEVVRNHFDAGIVAALTRLKRVAQETKLDRSELRQLAAESLSQFAIEMKATTKPEQLARFKHPALERVANERLAEFDAHLRFAFRQFDVGFLDLEKPEETVTNNSIKIETAIGSNIQQASPNANQSLSFTLSVSNIKAALSEFETAMEGMSLPKTTAADVGADIQTIRAQLEKPAPSPMILQEAGRSIRNVLEGLTAGLLTPPVIAAASALMTALGLI